MRCPNLQELPPPLKGKTGWPWAEETPQFSSHTPDKSRWPKISIITPSYNQGRFIEETIRSVLLQGYPDLEYIIIDGNSQDSTIDILHKYKKFLSYCVHETDTGQSQAINKGFLQATGDIIAWLNSDDLYLPFTLQRVVSFMWEKGEIIRPIIYGDCEEIDDCGKVLDIGYAQPLTRERLIKYWRRKWYIPQPTVFFASYVIKGRTLNENLHYVMDWDFYLQLSEKYEFYNTKVLLAKFRYYKGTKTFSKRKYFWKEHLEISKTYWGTGIKARWYGFEYKIWPLVYALTSTYSQGIRIVLKFIFGQKIYEKLKHKKRMIFNRDRLS